MQIEMPAGASARHHTQARGRARRQLLLQAARSLLFECDLDQITLPAVAEKAGIPVSSTYHFYSDMKDLYKDLAREIASEMIAIPREIPEPRTWEDLVRFFNETGRDFYNKDLAARQLMLGPKTAPDIKRAGCAQEAGFGDALMRLIEIYFILPDMADPRAIFFRSIQVADAMFMISMEEHGQLTEEYFDEATNAMLAYLGLYLPKNLRRRTSPRTSG